MNYTTITINGETIGLKFGMASFRYLQGKLVNGKTFTDNELNEIGIAHILYSGYYNNCLIKEIDTKLAFEDFVDWIEQNISNNNTLEDVKRAMDIWSSNDFIRNQTTETNTTTKKKSKRGKI
jgi:hypothetical protein